MYTKNKKSLEISNYQNESLLSPSTFESLIYGLNFVSEGEYTVVGSCASYLLPGMEKITNRTYEVDVDIAITRDAFKKIEDSLISERFKKGVIKDGFVEIKEYNREIPNGDFIMKYKDGQKELDILVGFALQDDFFHKSLEDSQDIYRISEKYKVGELEINLLRPTQQLAETLMLPNESRAKRFDLLYKYLLEQGISPSRLAKEVAEIIKDYSKSDKYMEKWWKELEKFGYIDNGKKARKQRFFASLEKRLS